MAYHLIQSPQLEDVIARHSQILLPKDLFDLSSIVVVQNQQTADWLSHTLAKKNVIVMGFSCQLTEQAFRQLALGFDCVRRAVRYDDHTQIMAHPFLFDDDLQLLIYQRLQQNLEHEDLTFIRDYLQKVPVRMQDIRLWSLAHDIAQWFAQYARSSPHLMRIWRKGHSFSEIEETDSQVWQKFLWFSIFGGENPAYNILGDWLDRIMQQQAAYQGQIRRVVLIGSVFLNEVYLDFLQFLAQKNLEVFHFMLEPLASPETATDLPFLVNHAEMYRQLQQYFQGYPSTQVKRTPMPLPNEQSLLHMLQYTLYYGQPLLQKIPPDQSLRRITCSDEEREVEVLKDMLLHRLDEDETLNLNEIAIVAPDINKYAAYIQAVFERGEMRGKLPYNIIDLDDNADPAFIQASLGLLNLAGARFSRKEIFDLLDNPLLVQRYDIEPEDRDIWINFCEETDILLNKNREQRQALELGKNGVNTFDHGFFRFTVGQIFGDKNTAAGPGLTGLSQTTAEKIRKFTSIVNALYEDFYPLAQKKMILPQWLDAIEKRLSEHLASPGEDPRSLRMAFSHLRESSSKIAALPYAQIPISFFVVKQMISDVLQRQKRRVGRYLANGIVCSSLIPLRALPFKIIIVLGLNNGEFPQMSAKKTRGYDLLQSHGLRSQMKICGEKHYLDRYAFLETIFSARQELWLFHQDRDTITGEKLSPSSSLADLEMFLAQMLCPEDQLEAAQQVFPKSPFSPHLFSDDCSSRSYAADQLELAKIRYMHPQPDGQSRGSQPVNPDTDEELWNSVWQDDIAVKKLLEFVRSPMDYFFRRVLRVDKSESTEIDKSERVDEAYDLSFYEQKDFYDKLVQTCLTNPEFHEEKDLFWHSVLNANREQRLKQGRISSRLLSRRSYRYIEESAAWLTQILSDKKLYNLYGPCILNDKQDSLPFLPPISYNLRGRQGKIYAEMPHLFINSENRELHYIRIDHGKPSLGYMAEDFLSFLLCFLSLSEYTLHQHIFYIKEKVYKHGINQTDKTVAMRAVNSIVEAFFMTKKIVPLLSLYQQDPPKNLNLDIKKYQKKREEEAHLLQQIDARDPYLYEQAISEYFYIQLKNFILK